MKRQETHQRQLRVLRGETSEYLRPKESAMQELQETQFRSLGREDSPGGGHGIIPLQYSCLENPMDRGTWQATVHSVSKSQTQLKWLRMNAHGWAGLGWIAAGFTWFELAASTQGRRVCFLVGLPRDGTQGDWRRVGLELCQQLNTKNGARIFITIFLPLTCHLGI